MISPTYAENIIVGIKVNNIFNWYILQKEICLLNLNVLTPDNFSDYMNNKICYEVRKDIIVVERGSIGKYIKNIEKFKVKSDELRLQIFDMYQKEEIGDFDIYFPILFLDFDAKTFYSQYPENFSFENYIPNDWKFKYEDFTHLIKEEEQYWMYKRKNLFEYGENLKEIKKQEKYNIDDMFKKREKKHK